MKMTGSARIGLGLVSIIMLAALIGPVFYPVDPLAQNLGHCLEPPGQEHWCGTDELGRDLLSRLLTGLGSTLFISLAGVILGTGIGVAVGLTAGYYGGLIDLTLMRFTEILLAFPGFLLALTIATTFKANHINLILAVSVFTVPGLARMVRARTLELRNQDYVTAARSIGSSEIRLLARHLLPNIFPLVLTLTTQRLSMAMLTASGLSFLGLGPQPPVPELGAMLNTGREYIRVAPHLSTLPGVILSLCILGFNLLGYGLKNH